MAYVKRQKKTISLSEKKDRRARAKSKRIAEKERIARIGSVFHPDVIRGVKTIGEVSGS